MASAVFRALVGTVEQTLTNVTEVQVRTTGALQERNEAIKLKYLQLSIDPGGLLLAGLASVAARFEYNAGGWEFRHDLIVSGASIAETTKDWFFPDDFPVWVAEDVAFSIGCGNIEYDQILEYKLIYEIVKISDMEMLQHLQNFNQFGSG